MWLPGRKSLMLTAERKHNFPTGINPSLAVVSLALNTHWPLFNACKILRHGILLGITLRVLRSFLRNTPLLFSLCRSCLMGQIINRHEIIYYWGRRSQGGGEEVLSFPVHKAAVNYQGLNNKTCRTREVAQPLVTLYSWPRQLYLVIKTLNQLILQCLL